MQNVSCEPLMLQLSENPQSTLRNFQTATASPCRGGHPSQGDKPTSTPKSDKAHIWNPPVYNIMAVVCSSCAMVLVVLGV